LLLTGTALAFGANLIGLFTDSLLMLFIARFVAGVSFGFVSVAAFDIIGRQGGSRAAGMALYLTAYVAAGICGAGLGALIVDRAGIPVVFVLGLIATVLSALTLRGITPIAPNPDYMTQPLLKAIGVLFSRNRFVRLIVLITLPMQIVQQGLLFYWVPLALSALGEHPSFIGLTMMGYFLMVLLLNGPLAGIADRTGRHAGIIVGGLALAGFAIMLNGLTYNPVVIAMANLLIGVAWALGFPSQGAMALRISQTELAGVDPAVTIGVYRAIERLGAMLAPMLVAVLIVWLGYAHSALLMGAVMLICALSYGWISRRTP
jgi:predicted MFS family arabinose efflux permease